MRKTLTAFVPAHKQTNPEHVPGQQVNPLGFTVNNVKPKLTFGQWADTATEFDIEQVDFVYHGIVWDMLEKCWNAAQENCR